MASWTFPLPQGAGKRRVDVESITIREVNGKDEELAETWSQAKGKQGNTLVELLRLSIVKVNGVAVPQPFGDFDGWNSRTRKFAMDAFAEINGTTKDEKDAFLAGAVEEDANGAGLSSVSG